MKMCERGEMYSMRPIFQLPEKIDLPTCMYATRSIVNPKRSDGQYDTRNSIVDVIKDKMPQSKITALEERWERVIDQVKDLIKQVHSIKQQIYNLPPLKSSDTLLALDSKLLDCLKIFEGAVINANPSRPPYSLFLIKQICKNSLNITSHVHSSVNSVPENLQTLCQSQNSETAAKMTLIWKEGNFDSELILNPLKQIPIRGEVNILRHLGRMGLDFLGYPSNDVCETLHMDSILDICHRLQHSQASKEISSLYRNLNAKLGRNLYFGIENLNICDIAVWSVSKQIDAVKDLTPNMSKWFKKIDAIMS